ncbi:MAG: M23 family metallopeptidase [Spirochaetales bacterium]|nr:M23 family metallopeptidase [Spirochaetales bacterium]
MQKKIPLIISFLCLFFLCSFDWPVSHPVITGVFGEYRQDHFHSGIDIGGDIKEVRPVGPGEVVFVHEESHSYSSLPAGLGNYITVEHANQLRSLYCHLEDQSIPRRIYQVTAESVIGIVGNSGYSIGKHLHLSFFDQQTMSFFNPFLKLPGLPDAQYPVVLDVFVQRSGNSLSLFNAKTLPEGDYSVFVHAIDFRNENTRNKKFLPHDISVLINGQTAGHILYDRIATENNESVLGQDKKKLYELYRDGEIYIDTIHFDDVRFPAGNIMVTVKVKDFSGNAVEKNFLVSVRGVE